MPESLQLPNRWLIAVMGTLLQLCLGTVYAWSYFQQPLVDRYGWSHRQVAWVFSLAICSLGLAAAWGGPQLARHGPRRLAVAGGLLFGIGYLVAALALHLGWLPLVYLGYGLISGIGLGLGYVTPVATVAKWFPDKKGLATGMVIMGFGFGALVMSKLIAPALFRLAEGAPAPVFAWLGVGFLVVTVAAAAFLRNPPPGYAPAGKAQAVSGEGGNAIPAEDAGAWFSIPFVLMWLIFFCNILAGISVIGFQSPLLQDLWHQSEPELSAEALATCGATLIAVSSLFNGVGRMLWGALSDHIGRLATFRTLLATQIVAFLLLGTVRSPGLFAALVCWVLLCYGGGFGAMPAFVLDRFGPRRMAVVYGAILTAWSAAGIAGPQMVAFFKDRFPQRAAQYSFALAAGVLGVGLLLTLRAGVLRPRTGCDPKRG